MAHFAQALLALLFTCLTACTTSSSHHASPYPVAVGVSFKDKSFAPELVVIPAGSFMMGASAAETQREGRSATSAESERPVHRVTLMQPLAVGRYPVTRQEYAAFVTATRRTLPSGCMVLDGQWQLEAQRSFMDAGFAQTDKHPAVCVSVADAQAYAAWLSNETGATYRLLHEAEWEYAARATTQTTRWWSDDRTGLCAHANGADQSFDRAYPGDSKVNTRCNDGYVHTNPVDAFAANRFGLHDMIGNVWEWVADCFTPDYAQAPSDASASIEIANCQHQVIRGGSWHNYPDALRAAARFWLPSEMRSSSVGFRLARLPNIPTSKVP